MPPSPSRTEPAEPEPPGLTRRDVLGTLALGLAVVGLSLGLTFLVGRGKAARLKPTPPDRPRQLVEFSLTDRTGRTVTRAELSGKILVVNFVFTSCSISCRVVNDRMEEIQRLVQGADDVKLVSVTVDPRSDTPSALAKFAAGYHADTNRWLFLTGDKAEVYRVLETSFLPRTDDLDNLIPGGFTGTDRIVLVDARGNLRGSFNGLKHDIAPAVMAEIKQLRKL